MFSIVSKPLEGVNWAESLASNQAGAFCSFEGRVRDNQDGRRVKQLEYQAHEPLCQTEAEKILDEAKSKFNIIDSACLHRVGLLNVGEVSVVVGVIAPHRDEAFKACQYIIDELKKRLPIWKKEFFTDGDSGWVNCQKLQSSI